MSDDDLHTLSFTSPEGEHQVQADWVVDTTGRRRLLAKEMGLAGSNAIDHGSSFLWVDGLVDIDKLTELSSRELRQKRERRDTGHLPTWLATTTSWAKASGSGSFPCRA